MDSTRADILVFGSSRANHHYVPEVFEKKLNMSFYNTGRDGNFILYNYMVFQSVINRYNPKIIIFDLNPNELSYNKGEYERIASLLPYYQEHNEIREIINKIDALEKLKLFSKIYPYNSMFLTIAVGNLELNKKRKTDFKGYVPLSKVMTDTILLKYDNMIGNVDPELVKLLNEIAFKCNKNEIALYFVVSPIYMIISENSSIRLYKDISDKYGCSFDNFSNNSIFIKNPNYFSDEAHLNENGAIMFSEIVADSIALNLKPTYLSLKYETKQ
jgi:hypothetical protein